MRQASTRRSDRGCGRRYQRRSMRDVGGSCRGRAAVVVAVAVVVVVVVVAGGRHGGRSAGVAAASVTGGAERRRAAPPVLRRSAWSSKRFSMPLCWRLRISQRRSFDSLMPIRMSLTDS